MDRRLADKNLRTGLFAAAIAVGSLRARVHIRDLLPRLDDGRRRHSARPSSSTCPSPRGTPRSSRSASRLVIAGIFVWWPYGAIGAIIAIVAIVRMYRGTRGQRRAPAAPPEAHDGRPPGRSAQDAPSPARLGRRALSVNYAGGLGLGRGHARRRAVRRPHAHDVAHREHADQLAALDDNEVADVAARHLHRRALEAPVGRRRDDGVGEVIADALGVGILAACRARPGCRVPTRRPAPAADRRSRRRRRPRARSSSARPREACVPARRSRPPQTSRP